MSSFDPVTLKYLSLAVKLEQNTNKFYETARKTVTDPNMKAVLGALMDHETGHLDSAVKVRDLYAAKQTGRARAAAALREPFQRHEADRETDKTWCRHIGCPH